MFSSRSEETREERRGGEHPKTKAAPPPQQEKKPKFEEFRRESHGKPGASGPFSEDTFYSMRDESDEVTDGTRTKKKVEFQTETHVEVMSDKKVEVFETSSVNVTPQPAKKQTFRQEQKVRSEPKVEKTHHVSRITKHVRETPMQVPRDTSSETPKIKIEVINQESHKAKMATQVKATPKPKPEEASHPASRSQVKFEKKPQIAVIKEPKVEVQPKVPIVEPLKSTGLVKMAVTRQEEKKVELDLKPFPFKPDPEKAKKPRGPPPSKPSKFVKGEFHESDYESDYEGRPVPKWKPAESDGEDQMYGTVRAPHDKPKTHHHHIRTPTPPTVFDKPPEYEGPPRPKIDFPESEPEVERETTPEIIIPEKVEDIKPLPKIVPKEGKIFKSQPKRTEPPPRRSPSPVLMPGSPPVEEYAPPPKRQPPPPQEQPPPPPQPQPQPSRFSNAVGVESTKITKIADSSQHHQRFVTMQQTTRVIKFSDNRTGTSTTETEEIKVPPEKPKVVVREERKEKPLPPLEPFPFTPEPDRQKKPRGAPPPMPKKFRKGEFTESDYDSDYEGRVRPKWQPQDSDTEDPSYARVKPQLHSDRTPSKSRERTPTPPTQFDTPPEAGGPWRPKVEAPPPPPPVVVREPSPELVIPKEPPKKIETVKKVAKVAKKVVKVEERAPSPPLPPPGTPPEIGVIEERTEYVVGRVNLKSRVAAPPMQEVQTYEEKPFTKVLERTEKTITSMKMEEELRMKKEKKEIKKTIVTEYEPVSMPQPVQPQVTRIVEKQLELEPFPFEPEPSKLRRERGPPPPKPKKFVKGEFRESDYDSDFEGRMRPKWKPADSDVEDPEYTSVRPPPPSDRHPSRSKERIPTPPTQFEVPPSGGGPLRPTIEPIERPVLEVKEPSPEVVIPKITEKPLPKTKKVVPKAPAIRQQEPPPPPPRSPTPPLPEPEPQPEIGYAPAQTKQIYEEKEDVHIKMIKKKIESKKGVQIDIDITDVYDLVSESEPEKIEPETSKTKPFPKLEPFPYTPEPGRPKRMRGPPPPQPKKFLKGEFRGSDYESDYDSHIAPKWVPPDSEGEEFAYRRVAPPASETARHREESSAKEPSPPSKFDQPPQFEGPPRPVVDLSDLPRRERRESLEEYSIPRFPKVEFKPFDLEDEQVRQPKGAATTDTETESEFLQTDIDKKYVKSAQKVVSHQFEDMTQTFRHKAQKFAEQLVTEVFAAREGSVPAEPAGEPPSLPEELKTQAPTTEATPQPTTKEDLSSLQEPQAYRDESRVSEFGTKHIDPDTGLIYFKYDFGYEFGVILPGEAKKVDKKSQMNGDHSDDMPIPIIHEKTNASKKAEKQTPQANGHVQHLETTQGREHTATLSDAMPKGSSALGAGTDHLSPHPSQQSDISETDREYQQYMGKMIPEFVPKKQAQFRPISGDPYSDSEVESDHPSPAKTSEASPSIHSGPKRFIPLVPGAAVQPNPLPQGAPADALCSTTALGVLGSPLSATPPSTPSTPCSGPLTQPSRPPQFITPLRDLSVAAGEALRLECVVQADPPVQVTWAKGGDILENGPDYQIVYRNGVCRLIIPHVFPDDEGVYSCTAVNLLGTVTTSATVCITGEKK